MNSIKRLLSAVLSLAMLLSISTTAFAANNNQSPVLKQGSSPVLQQVSQLLDTSPTTQTIIRSEKEMIEEMLREHHFEGRLKPGIRNSIFRTYCNFGRQRIQCPKCDSC